MSSVRAGTRHHDALPPRLGSPGVTRDYQRCSRPSPFHPLFEDCDRYAGNSEIQHPWGLASDGETRTRTGDTTIFSRVLLSLKSPGFAGRYRRSGDLRPVQIFSDCASFFRGLRPTPRLVGLFISTMVCAPGDENRAAPTSRVISGYCLPGWARAVLSGRSPSPRAPRRWSCQTRRGPVDDELTTRRTPRARRRLLLCPIRTASSGIRDEGVNVAAWLAGEDDAKTFVRYCRASSRQRSSSRARKTAWWRRWQAKSSPRTRARPIRRARRRRTLSVGRPARSVQIGGQRIPECCAPVAGRRSSRATSCAVTAPSSPAHARAVGSAIRWT